MFSTSLHKPCRSEMKKRRENRVRLLVENKKRYKKTVQKLFAQHRIELSCKLLNNWQLIEETNWLALKFIRFQRQYKVFTQTVVPLSRFTTKDINQIKQATPLIQKEFYTYITHWLDIWILLLKFFPEILPEKWKREKKKFNTAVVKDYDALN